MERLKSRNFLGYRHAIRVFLIMVSGTPPTSFSCLIRRLVAPVYDARKFARFSL
jgi:hypothetical protein